MYDSTFTPAVGGQTWLVGTSSVQPNPPGIIQAQLTSCRVRCLATGYLTYAAMLGGNANPSVASTTVAAGAPAVNTIGMTTGGIETFQFPQNAWFISSVAGGFEITFGEGQ